MIERKRLKRRHGPDSLDITGRNFGLWKVLGFAGHHTWPSGQQHQKWRCKCQCGITKDVLKPHLVSGKSRGCRPCRKAMGRKPDLTGRNFGGWQVVARDPRYPNKYTVRHTCGHERHSNHALLTAPTTPECAHCKFRAAVTGIGGKMRKRRMDQGLTLDKVAVHLGVTQQRVAQMENSPDRWWSPKRRKRIITALEELR